MTYPDGCLFASKNKGPCRPFILILVQGSGGDLGTQLAWPDHLLKFKFISRVVFFLD